MQPDPVAAHLSFLSMKGLSASTIRHREQQLTRLREFLGFPLEAATHADLMTWREFLDQANSTIAVYASHVMMFYRWGYATGLIAADPAATLPVPKVPRRLPRPISEDDLAEAVDSASRRVRIWLVLAAWEGLRAKEISGLRGENVKLRAARPIILVASDATKGMRERAVPLSGFAIAELAYAGLPLRGLCFRKADGNPVPPNLVSKLCNQHLHDCGIPATLHQLRHRFGTQVYHVRRDLRATQELLGHSSPSTTAIYAAYDNAEAAADVEAIPAPYGKTA